MTVAEGGGIFVSYRRQESSHLAGRLADRLADRFGESQVFIDVDTIEPGVDFAEEIILAVAACKVLLAIIGPNWLTATDEQGRRRLDAPDDIVRLEVEAALARGVRVIPILVEGAVMPAREDLPDSLAGLVRRNALLIRHESFRSDVGRLVTAIDRVLAAASGTAAVSSTPDAHGVRTAGNMRSTDDRVFTRSTISQADRQAREETVRQAADPVSIEEARQAHDLERAILNHELSQEEMADHGQGDIIERNIINVSEKYQPLLHSLEGSLDPNESVTIFAARLKSPRLSTVHALIALRSKEITIITERDHSVLTVPYMAVTMSGCRKSNLFWWRADLTIRTSDETHYFNVLVMGKPVCEQLVTLMREKTG